jgi:hypothetical protein
VARTENIVRKEAYEAFSSDFVLRGLNVSQFYVLSAVFVSAVDLPSSCSALLGCSVDYLRLVPFGHSNTFQMVEISPDWLSKDTRDNFVKSAGGVDQAWPLPHFDMARIFTIRPAPVYKRPLGVTLNVSDTFYCLFTINTW